MEYQDFSQGFVVSREMWEEGIETAGALAETELESLTGRESPMLVSLLRWMVSERDKIRAEKEAAK